MSRQTAFRVISNRQVAIAVILISFSGVFPAASEVIDLEFKQPADSGSETDRTLSSLVKVQDPGGVTLNGLYLMTHYGNREKLFQHENQIMIETPLLERPWRYCSIFSSSDDKNIMMGRNWDNENVGSIIVNYYRPPNGYSSISFSRSIDMNFPLNVDLQDFISSDLGKSLLLAPFYSFDGINEHGLAVSVAGVRGIQIKPKDDSQLVYVPFLVRKILDRTKSVDEVLLLVEKLIPFDLDQHSLNTHFLVVDASGNSVILEYVDGEWKKFFSKKFWQVLTNKPIHCMTDEELREKSWRYRSISESFQREDAEVNWKSCLGILQDVAQKGTSWSVVYSPTNRDLYFSVYQNWDVVYHLKMPTTK